MNGSAAAAAAIAQAIKASGALVRMSPEGFKTLVGRTREPLIVIAEGGLFSRKYQYLMGYKGLIFFTSSKEQIGLPSSAEVVTAKSIWMPS